MTRIERCGPTLWRWFRAGDTRWQCALDFGLAASDFSSDSSAAAICLTNGAMAAK